MKKEKATFKPKIMERIWSIGEDGEPFSCMYTRAKGVQAAEKAGNIFKTREEAMRYELVAVRRKISSVSELFDATEKLRP